MTLCTHASENAKTTPQSVNLNEEWMTVPIGIDGPFSTKVVTKSMESPPPTSTTGPSFLSMTVMSTMIEPLSAPVVSVATMVTIRCPSVTRLSG